jgi:hypothetical protein
MSKISTRSTNFHSQSDVTTRLRMAYDRGRYSHEEDQIHALNTATPARWHPYAARRQNGSTNGNTLDSRNLDLTIADIRDPGALKHALQTTSRLDHEKQLQRLATKCQKTTAVYRALHEGNGGVTKAGYLIKGCSDVGTRTLFLARAGNS